MSTEWARPVAPPPRGTRPRNRRQLIITAAADLFVTKGYAQVSMADVAEAVAVGPSALYRHFRSKDDLLFEVVRAALHAIAETVRELRGPADLAAAALTHRRLGVLWQRESRRLPSERREVLRAELVEISRSVCKFVASRRPDLPEDDVEVIAWAILAAVTSLSFQRIELETDEYRELLTAIVEDVIRVRLDEPLTALAPPPMGTPDDRRAELIDAAGKLFAERGYHTVGVDDVGAAVGIAGPSIYHHFATELDLMMAVMHNGTETLLAATDGAVTDAADDRARLEGLARSYAGFCFAHSEIVDVLVTETAGLPQESRDEMLRAQRAYRDRWLQPLARLYPDRPKAHSRVRLQAALNLINDIARTPHLRARSRTADLVATIGLAVVTG